MTTSHTETKEKMAIACVASPGRLKARLKRARSVLVPNIKFKERDISVEGKNWTSGCGKYRLQWKLRDNPSLPESYENQQTTTGIVCLVLNKKGGE